MGAAASARTCTAARRRGAGGGRQAAAASRGCGRAPRTLRGLERLTGAQASMARACGRSVGSPESVEDTPRHARAAVSDGETHVGEVASATSAHTAAARSPWGGVRCRRPRPPGTSIGCMHTAMCRRAALPVGVAWCGEASLQCQPRWRSRCLPCQLPRHRRSCVGFPPLLPAITTLTDRGMALLGLCPVFVWLLSMLAAVCHQQQSDSLWPRVLKRKSTPCMPSSPTCAQRESTLLRLNPRPPGMPCRHRLHARPGSLVKRQEGLPIGPSSGMHGGDGGGGGVCQHSHHTASSPSPSPSTPPGLHRAPCKRPGSAPACPDRAGAALLFEWQPTNSQPSHGAPSLPTRCSPHPRALARSN